LLGISKNPFSGALNSINNGSDPVVTSLVGPLYGQQTTATVPELHEIYLADFVWLRLLFVSSIFLFLITLVGSILKCMCLAPDTFAYISSMTYDNASSKLPPGGT